MSQVWIRMRTLSAGPQGVRLSGAEVEVDEKEAAALLEGGYAERIAAPGSGEIETAQLPEGETAAAPPAGRKPRGPRA